jgi:hypothetical protein
MALTAGLTEPKQQDYLEINPKMWLTILDFHLKSTWLGFPYRAMPLRKGELDKRGVADC